MQTPIRGPSPAASVRDGLRTPRSSDPPHARLVPFPMRIPGIICATALVCLLAGTATALAQLSSFETNDLRLVYVDPTQSFLAPHVGRASENSLEFQRKLFDFTPSEKITA